MIIVTGGAGFIGSNLVKALNERGRCDILVVDDLRDGRKFANLVDCVIADYWDRGELEAWIVSGRPLPQTPDAVFHQGACSDTTVWDGSLMLDTNYRYSKMLFEYCRAHRIPFLYASSAAVYGAGPAFVETPGQEAPLNLYAFSKCLFDRYVSRHLDAIESQVVGLRYFNVYGPREQHKGAMASIAWQLCERLRRGEALRLFEGHDGYGDGEQRRDFVHVDDVIAVNLWFLDNPRCRGIFNVGTGRSQTFNDVARALIDWYGGGHIEYIAFPPSLAGRYQSFTEADITKLRGSGFARDFLGVEEGVRRYMGVLDQRDARA